MVASFEKERKNIFEEIFYIIDGFDKDGFHKKGFGFQGFDQSGFNKKWYQMKQVIDW